MLSYTGLLIVCLDLPIFFLNYPQQTVNLSKGQTTYYSFPQIFLKDFLCARLSVSQAAWNIRKSTGGEILG